jgi:hypothetical protein
MERCIMEAFVCIDVMQVARDTYEVTESDPFENVDISSTTVAG